MKKFISILSAASVALLFGCSGNEKVLSPGWHKNGGFVAIAKK